MKKFLLLFIMFLCGTLYSQPIQLYPQNPHYLLYEDKPALLITSGEHYGSVINLDFDYTKYLQTLAQDGLNYTSIFTGACLERAGSFGIEKNTLAPMVNRALVPWARSATSGYIIGGTQCNVTLKLSSGSFQAEWVDTKTGRVAIAAPLDHKGGRVLI